MLFINSIYITIPMHVHHYCRTKVAIEEKQGQTYILPEFYEAKGKTLHKGHDTTIAIGFGGP